MECPNQPEGAAKAKLATALSGRYEVTKCPFRACGTQQVQYTTGSEFVKFDVRYAMAPAAANAYCHDMSSPRILFLLVAVILVVVATAHSGDLKCDYCKKPLTGTYRVFEGKNLHESCFQAHFALRCAHCDKPILDRYTVYEGKNYHDACYSKHLAKYCSICAGEISGQYYQDAWGNLVHAAHIGEYAQCDYCGRLKAEKLTGKGARYLDGREICGACLKSAVTEIADARAVLVQAREKLRRYGIEIEQDFNLQLINKTEMARLGPVSHSDLRGFAELKERSALFGAVKEQKINIFALVGMPRDVLLGVLAHELMHVWMFTNCPDETDDVLAEGSCEYAAYLVLRDRSSDLMRYCLESMDDRDDPVYGTGYRKVTGFVQRVGIDGWLDYLQKYPAAPWR